MFAVHASLRAKGRTPAFGGGRTPWVWLLLFVCALAGPGLFPDSQALAGRKAAASAAVKDESAGLAAQVDALMRDNRQANRRDNWLPLTRRIDEALAAPRDGESVLLLAKAKARADMGRRFATKADDDAARSALDTLLAKYPKNAQTPQALWLRAQLAARQGREADAGADLTRLLTDYPASSYAAKVRAKAKDAKGAAAAAAGQPKATGAEQAQAAGQTALPAQPLPAQQPGPAQPVSQVGQALAKGQPAKARPGVIQPLAQPAGQTPGQAAQAAPAPSGQASQPGQAAQAKGKESSTKTREAAAKGVELNSLRATGGPDYSRVIAGFPKATPFSAHLADQPKGKPEAPRLLHIDFPEASLAQVTETETTGILRSAKATSLGPKGVRLTLEVDNLSRYQVFPIDGGSRVVADIFGCATPAPSSRYDARNDELLAKGKGGKGRGKVAAAKVSAVCDLAEQLGLSVKTVLIDAGHGGKDPGCKSAGGVFEKDVNLRLARLLGAELKKDGLEVVYSRESDVFVPLEGRPAAANARKADLFVSLHCNSHDDKRMSGVETYTFNLAKSREAVRVASAENGVSARGLSDMQAVVTELLLSSKRDESRDLAKAVHASMLKPAPIKGHRDKGPAEAPFYVLMGAKMPAILVEVGYLTNPEEGARLSRQDHLEKLAKSIADGVMAYKGKLERNVAKSR